MDEDLSQEPDNNTTQEVYATNEETGKVYIYQTGELSFASIKGKKYIMMMYVYYADKLMTEPLKNRTGPKILHAYKKMFEKLTVRLFKPTIHWIDNKSSLLLQSPNQ